MDLQLPSFILPVPRTGTGAMEVHNTFVLDEQMQVKCDMIDANFSYNCKELKTLPNPHFPQAYL